MASLLEIPCAASISFDEAQTIVRHNSAPIGMEFVPLGKAGRRILARDVVAMVDSPRRDCAAMDGYAVRSSDLVQETTRFRLVGESCAGGSIPASLRPGTAIRISTGAPMPAGADRVVMREHAEVEAGFVRLPNRSGKAHVRVRGDDFMKGQLMLPSGTCIDARAMVVAAAADVDGVTVWRRPRVHLLANGDELVAPGKAAMAQDAVPDSLSEALMLMVRQWGGKPIGLSISRDQIEELREKAQFALAEADILVVVGGASHGHRDLARSALLPLGLRLEFAGVAMKPGKPLWFGRIGQTRIIGLPGNPTAALTTARLFLAPLITAMAGSGFDAALGWASHPVLHDIDAGLDRDQFLCGSSDDDGIRIIELQQASAQMMLAQADILVERRAGAPSGQSGATLRCISF